MLSMLYSAVWHLMQNLNLFANLLHNLNCHFSNLLRHEWLKFRSLVKKNCIYFIGHFSMFGYCKTRCVVSEGAILGVRKGCQVPKACYPIWIQGTNYRMKTASQKKLACKSIQLAPSGLDDFLRCFIDPIT